MISSENEDDLTGKSDLSQSAEISANDQMEHIYQLKISWPVNTTSDTAGENTDLQNPDYAGKVDVIEITLKAVQKD